MFDPLCSEQGVIAIVGFIEVPGHGLVRVNRSDGVFVFTEAVLESAFSTANVKTITGAGEAIYNKGGITVEGFPDRMSLPIY